MPSTPLSVCSLFLATPLLLTSLTTDAWGAILLERVGSEPLPVATFQAAVDELALYPGAGEPYTGELILTDSAYSGPGNRDLNLFPLAGSTYPSIKLRNVTGERADCVIDLDGFRIGAGTGLVGVEFHHLTLEDGMGLDGDFRTGRVKLVDCDARDLDLRGTTCSAQGSTVRNCSLSGSLSADDSVFEDFDASFSDYVDASGCTFRRGAATGFSGALFTANGSAPLDIIEIRNTLIEGCSATRVVYSGGNPVLLDGSP